MSIQNASSPGYGYQVTLSQNLTWFFPFLPGEPPNVLRYNTSVCVPSNITIAQTCCSAVNGTFVTSQLSNRTAITEADLLAILNAKYPNRNNTQYATSSTITGDLTPASNASDGQGGINWCATEYSPMSSTAFQNGGYVSGGDLLGNVPQSIESWINCFNSNTPVNATQNAQAVYVCMAKDVLTGGEIDGFVRYSGPPSSGARAVMGMSGIVMSLALLGVMGLSVC